MDEPERCVDGEAQHTAEQPPGHEVGGGFLVVFGRQMKALRERAKMDRATFGSQVGYSPSSIASFEQGKRIPPPSLIDQADHLLDAGGALTAGKEEVARAQYPAFFRDAAALEAEAVELHVYDTLVVNGLMQTPEYARSVFGMLRPALSEEVIEQRVAARITRQQIFERKPAPLMSFVIDEAVLRRRVGGTAVLRGQLKHLLHLAALRGVEIQVMPLDEVENAGLAGPFTLIETKSARRIAYVEVQQHSRLYTDRAPVRALEAKYGTLRAQALTPHESRAYMDKLLGEL